MATITQAINDNHGLLKGLIDEYIPLLSAARGSNDPIVPGTQIYEVTRRLADVSKQYRDSLKEAITLEMQETGTVETEAGPYTVTLRKGSTRPVVTDEKKLRQALPSVFEPQPDKLSLRKLGQELKFKQIEGAELVEGAPTIAVKGNTK